MPVRRNEQAERRRRRELLRALLDEEEAEYEEPVALEQELLAMVRDLRRRGRRPGLGGLMSSEQLQGFMWGLGVATLLLMLLPSAKQTLRPFAVSVVKGALDLADQVKGLFGEAGEGLQDLLAEAQFERVKRAAEPGGKPDGT
ncbi:MAG TPA: DUF5132 domain-containing protein [Symbiobacteriaceae bacterium]|nr:DUF5132 domain-containing protein [Symbiobacteriaceae bacterium]